jgi:hypothetical protein
LYSPIQNNWAEKESSITDAFNELLNSKPALWNSELLQNGLLLMNIWIIDTSRDIWPKADLFNFNLTPKIPGPFLPISTSKMLKFSKKSQKKLKIKKMLKFQPHKDYDLLDSLNKSCQKILKILTVVACRSSCNPLWVLWNFRG